MCLAVVALVQVLFRIGQESPTLRRLAPVTQFQEGHIVVHNEGMIADDALWLTEYQFGPMMTPSSDGGDFIIHDGQIFVGWWKG